MLETSTLWKTKIHRIPSENCRNEGKYSLAQALQKSVNRIGAVMVSVLASSEVDRGFIGAVMVSVLASSEVDRGFIGAVMVSVFASSEVDRGFIGAVMVSMLASSVVDRGFNPCRVKPKTIKLVVVASLLSTQH